MIRAYFRNLQDETEIYYDCERVTMTDLTYHILKDGAFTTHLRGYALIDVQAIDVETDKQIKLFNFMYGGTCV